MIVIPEEEKKVKLKEILQIYFQKIDFQEGKIGF